MHIPWFCVHNKNLQYNKCDIHEEKEANDVKYHTIKLNKPTLTSQIKLPNHNEGILQLNVKYQTFFQHSKRHIRIPKKKQF